MAFVALIAVLGAVGGALGWGLWQDPGATSIPDILRGTLGGASEGAGPKPPGPQRGEVPDVEGLSEHEARERLKDAGFEAGVRFRESSVESAGRVLEQSLPGGKEAQKGSQVLLTVGEAPEVVEVPNLVGLSYPEAEHKLLEAGLLLGGVREAPSETVAAGMIIKQNPPPGTTLEPNSYVYLTTSVGPPPSQPDTAKAGGGGQGGGAIGGQHGSSSETSSGEVAVADAVRGHYEAVGAGSFEEAYAYFGPTFRSQHDEASWISSEQSFEIRSSTIHSLTVDEISGTTATATVDVSFVDNTGAPRFVIVWGLVKEGGRWKLDEQYSAQRIG